MKQPDTCAEQPDTCAEQPDTYAKQPDAYAKQMDTRAMRPLRFPKATGHVREATGQIYL